MDFEGIYISFGVVTGRELRTNGVSRSQQHRRNNELRPAYPGVSFCGPLRTGDEAWWQRAAAALAYAGPDAVLARRAAAFALELDGFDRRPNRIDVNVPRRSSIRGPFFHRASPLDDRYEGAYLPTTGVGQTLIELGADLGIEQDLTPVEQVELALESALHKRLTTLDSLGDLLGATSARRPGVAVLRAVLDERPDEPPAESWLETRVLQVLRRAGLGPLRRQVNICDRDDKFLGRVDFVFHHVVIECDGEGTHLDFHRDRRRWGWMDATGYEVQVFAPADLDLPDEMVARTLGSLAKQPIQPRLMRQEAGG